MQSEWLIVAGCAGLLVNTVLLRYLLRVLGERRVLCIGTLPGSRTRLLHASPARALSLSDNSCDPAVMAALIPQSVPPACSCQSSRNKGQTYKGALQCDLKTRGTDAQVWQSAACSSSVWPSPAPSTCPSRPWPSALWPISASPPSPASSPRAFPAMSRWPSLSTLPCDASTHCPLLSTSVQAGPACVAVTLLLASVSPTGG